MSNGSTSVTQNCQVTKSNRTYTLREFPKKFAKDRMRLHKLSHLSKKRMSICVFHKNRKKIKSKSQKNRKECHEHCTIFHCIALLHTKPALTPFQDKGWMHLHPKNHVHIKHIDFSFFPKFNVLSFEDERPSRRVNLLLSHKVEPLGTSTYWLVSQDSKSSLLSFIGLKVLAFIFQRTQSPHLLSFRGLKFLAVIFSKTIIVFCLTKTIKVIHSFTFQRLS